MSFTTKLSTTPSTESRVFQCRNRSQENRHGVRNDVKCQSWIGNAVKGCQYEPAPKTT